MDWGFLASAALFVVVAYALLWDLNRREKRAREQFWQMERDAMNRYNRAVDGMTVEEFLAMDAERIDAFNKNRAAEKEQANGK